jgi:tetrahydromethanopterin S-methyltransferase subunit G
MPASRCYSGPCTAIGKSAKDQRAGRIHGRMGLTLIMERTSWTDERVNDAMARIDQRFDGVERRLDAIDRRFEAVDRRFDSIDRRLDNMSVELREVRGDLLALNRQFGRLGWALAGGMFIQLVAIILTRSGA